MPVAGRPGFSRRPIRPSAWHAPVVSAVTTPQREADSSSGSAVVRRGARSIVTPVLADELGELQDRIRALDQRGPGMSNDNRVTLEGANRWLRTGFGPQIGRTVRIGGCCGMLGSVWGLAALVLLMLVGGTVLLRRRRVAETSPTPVSTGLPSAFFMVLQPR